MTVHEAQAIYLESVEAIKQAEQSVVELQLYVNKNKVELEKLADMFNEQIEGGEK